MENTSPRFLIVDDVLVNRQLLKHLLSPYGECFAASTGREALNFVVNGYENNQPVDLIFLDIMMPDMNGEEALKEIRAYEKDRGLNEQNQSKIIIATSLSSDEQRAKAVQEGAHHYLVKPLKLDEVRGILADLGYHPKEKSVSKV